jgi:hypothetical protein
VALAAAPGRSFTGHFSNVIGAEAVGSDRFSDDVGADAINHRSVSDTIGIDRFADDIGAEAVAHQSFLERHR